MLTLRPRPAFAAVAAATFAVLVGSNVPTALYDVYRRLWNFSALEMSAIFSIYTLTLVAALWAFARISDRFGRRPVLVAALVAAATSSLLFALARGPLWLFAARAVQGIAVALLSGASGAAMVELEPSGNRRRAALYTSLTIASGSAGGPLLGGLLAQYAPHPLQVPFVANLALALPLIPLLWFVPETAHPSRTARWVPRVPVLPEGALRPFAIASLVSGFTWLVTSLFISLVPSYLRAELGVTNLAFFGLVPCTIMCVSFVAQIFVRNLSEKQTMLSSLVLGTLGIGAVVLAVPLHSLPLIGAAALLCGVGHAAGTFGSLGTIARISAGSTRGETLSVHYSIVYLIISLPLVSIGALATGIGFFPSFAIFAAMITVSATGIAATILAGRSRSALDQLS